jgi:hypothetical protein
MIIKVDDVSVSVEVSDILVADSVNVYKASFIFDDSWNDYTRLAVFETDYALIELELDDSNDCLIPWEVLSKPGQLRIGVYGMSGDKIRPTLWSKSLTVYSGTIRGNNPGEYIPDSPVGFVSSAKIGYVTLLADSWIGDDVLFSQVVDIEGVTQNSQVDLTPSVEQLVIFYEKDLTFTTENENGVVTVYVIGQKPTNDYTIQVTITEVAYE